MIKSMFISTINTIKSFFIDDFETYTSGWSDLNNQGLWKSVYGSIVLVDVSDNIVAQPNSDNYVLYVYDAALNNDQYSKATLYLDEANGMMGPALRIQSDISSGYMFYTNQAWASIIKFDNGTTSTLANANIGTAGLGDVLKFEAIGTTLNAYINDVSIFTVTDASYSSGRSGLSGYNNGVNYVDIWEGGNL